MWPLSVQDMIEEVDLDASGTISIEEFYSMMGAKPDLPGLPDTEEQIDYPDEETVRCGFQMSNWALGVLGPKNCFRRACQVSSHTVTAMLYHCYALCRVTTMATVIVLSHCCYCAVSLLLLSCLTAAVSPLPACCVTAAGRVWLAALFLRPLS